MPINYKQYPYNWRTVIIPQIRERSGNVCESCGRKNGEVYISSMIKKRKGMRVVYRREWFSYSDYVPGSKFKQVTCILTVAHKNHDSTNPKPRLEDLIHECQLCHLRRDSYMKARRKACGKWCIWPNCNKSTCEEYRPA